MTHKIVIPERMDTSVSIKLYKEDVQLLKKICKDNHVSVSFVIRNLILDFLYPEDLKT